MRAVDPIIFERRYYGHCLHCGFCRDACCEHGVDVSLDERDRILSHADGLEPMIGLPAEHWFVPVSVRDEDFSGGASTRTAIVNGSCVFLRRGTRGCTLHAFALERGVDYHAVKPMVSALFPVTFGEGALLCSDELAGGSLVCAGEGPTAYEMARSEIGHYFGAELVSELDALATLAPAE